MVLFYPRGEISPQNLKRSEGPELFFKKAMGGLHRCHTTIFKFETLFNLYVFLGKLFLVKKNLCKR